LRDVCRIPNTSMDNDAGESPVHRDSHQPVPQECSFLGAAPIHNEDGTPRAYHFSSFLQCLVTRLHDHY
jgi:hypothetical protein